MRNWTLAAIVAITIIILAGCGGRPPSAGVSLTGKVVDGAAGTPIKDVRVALGSSSTLTKADGTFTLVGLALVSGTLTAQRTGYETSAVQVSIVTGSQSLEEDIRMAATTGNPPEEPVRTIGGTITLTGESNPTGVTVTLLSGSVEYDHMTTGATGKYWFWAPAGTYTVRAVKTGFVTQTKSVTVTDLTQIVSANMVLLRQ